MPHQVFDLVSDLGFEEIVELDWWNSYRHRGLTVTHVPSRHWGARILKDSHRGYGGYVLRDGKHSVYHAGDTAYFTGFSEIGAAAFAGTRAAADRRLQPAILPQRAHQPRRRDPRLSGSEVALDGAHALRNFRLSHEPMEEPLQLAGTGSRGGGDRGSGAGAGRRRDEDFLTYFHLHLV